MKKIAILGSTGSVGTSALEVIQKNRDLFSISLLTADRNKEKLKQQAKVFKPSYISLNDKKAAKELRRDISSSLPETEVISEKKKLFEIISDSEVDIVIAGIVGIAGLESVHQAIKSGKRLLLANKESYIVAGELLNSLAIEKEASIFPIDSEHSAIHQCIHSYENKRGCVTKLILTGSGGPFLDTEKRKFSSITPREATNHPIWKMGKKISVDSATLMNKGLEIIEAKWLFNMSSDLIELVIHPEGIVHSLVEFGDMSVIAHMSVPDMKVPIAYGLGFPSRINSGASRLELTSLNSLTFFEPDYDKFPCLNIADRALKAEGSAPTILNAANEVAVSAFLKGKIRFDQIPQIISFVMDKMPIKVVEDIEGIMEQDKLARIRALEYIKQ